MRLLPVYGTKINQTLELGVQANGSQFGFNGEATNNPWACILTRPQYPICLPSISDYLNGKVQPLENTVITNSDLIMF